jgi:phospholipase A-2-activating protein
MSMQVDFELSLSLTSNGQGLRCACVLPCAADGTDSIRILTGNQAGGLTEFTIPSLELIIPPFQHNHSVTALVSNDTVYMTGCKDAVIRAFDAHHHAPLGEMNGHEKAVTSFAWSGDYLLSGSWDGTAKVWDWRDQHLIATLGGHENSVCVASVSTVDNVHTIATGSAGIAQNNAISGQSIRIWQVNVKTRETAILRTVRNDHDGPIRSIAFLPDRIALASCSNDGTVKLRDCATGQATCTLVFDNQLRQQQQHPPMLLSVTAVVGAANDNSTSSLVATAEDGHVIVWNLDSSQPPQVIRHPNCVWNALALPNGDFATCGEDGTLRIFTQSTNRMASDEDRRAFQQQVQESLQQAGPSSEDVAKLPRWENCGSKRGTSEGQVQLFQKDGVAIAAQWSDASHTWIEVGQVMGSNADSNELDGVRYDHVLPIEVEQTGGGVANLRIGYNNGENMFVAAQRFVDSHMLPQYYVAQIADYIQQRTSQPGPTLGMGVPSAGVPMASYQYLPMKVYNYFDLSEKAATETLAKMMTKIEGFGKLSAEQLASISALMSTLAATSRYHSSKVDDSELAVIASMLEALPPVESFPALDLARMIVLHPDAADRRRSSHWSRVLQHAAKLCAGAYDGSAAAVAIPMLSLRLFVNAFKGGPGSLEAVASLLGPILACAIQHVHSANKNIRLSVATLIGNICLYLTKTSQGALFASQVVPIVSFIMDDTTYDAQGVTRVLVGIGTLVMNCPEAKEVAKQAFLASKVEPAASPHGSDAKLVAKEVYSVLA